MGLTETLSLVIGVAAFVLSLIYIEEPAIQAAAIIITVFLLVTLIFLDKFNRLDNLDTEVMQLSKRLDISERLIKVEIDLENLKKRRK